MRCGAVRLGAEERSGRRPMTISERMDADGYRRRRRRQWAPMEWVRVACECIRRAAGICGVADGWMGEWRCGGRGGREEAGGRLDASDDRPEWTSRMGSGGAAWGRGEQFTRQMDDGSSVMERWMEWTIRASAVVGDVVAAAKGRRGPKKKKTNRASRARNATAIGDDDASKCTHTKGEIGTIPIRLHRSGVSASVGAVATIQEAHGVRACPPFLSTHPAAMLACRQASHARDAFICVCST